MDIFKYFKAICHLGDHVFFDNARKVIMLKLVLAVGINDYLSEQI